MVTRNGAKSYYFYRWADGKPQKLKIGTPETLTVEQARKAVTPEYVLPGRRRGSHLQVVKTTFSDVLDRAKIKDFRPHDLRHTLASWMAAEGASEYVIGRALNHQASTVTARYSHLDAEPVREAMNKACRAMLQAAGARKPEK